MPRWAHRLYAWVFGWSWGPCRTCKRPYGGHEWRFAVDGWPGEIPDYSQPGRGFCICPICTARGLGAGTQSSTMCVCGDMQQMARLGSPNEFLPHVNRQTDQTCPGIPTEYHFQSRRGKR